MPKEGNKNEELVQQLENDYEKVKFVSFSIIALGIYGKSTTEFIDMMKMLKFDKRTRNYTIKKLPALLSERHIISSVDGTKNGQILNL